MLDSPARERHYPSRVLDAAAAPVEEELSDDERRILRCRLTEWGGPAHATEKLVKSLGFDDLAHSDVERKLLRQANTNGVGSFTYTARAADLAGNVTAQTIIYHVVYAWNGFAQPVNDTAHPVGSATSGFKAGSTVPLRYSLANAQGQVVVPTTAPIWVMPVQGGAISTPVNE